MDDQDVNISRSIDRGFGTLSAEEEKDLTQARGADQELDAICSEYEKTSRDIRLAFEYEKVLQEPVSEDMLAAVRNVFAEHEADTKKIVRFPLRKVAVALAACVAVLLVVLALIQDPGIQGAEPSGSITDTTPDIKWENAEDPEQKYDVWIIPAEGDYMDAPTILVVKDVRSPIAYEDLNPPKGKPPVSELAFGDYRLLVCLAGEGKASGTPTPFTVVKEEK